MLASLKFVDRFVTLTRCKSDVQTPAGTFERYDFDVPTLAPLLTRQGFEVESVAHFGEGFDSVVVGRIESAERHPKAEKLQVCQVNTGEAALRQIVCGAANARPGLFVAAALPGAKLPGGIEIKGAKLRDVESNGMLCSRAELGLPLNEATDGNGIWELHLAASCGQPEDTLAKMLGVPVFDALGLRDTLLELNVTPNRPDMLCHEGVAREVLAGLTYAGVPAQWRGHTFVGDAPFAAAEAAAAACTNTTLVLAGKPFSVENSLGVSAFFGALEGVSVGSSPAWLRAQLEALGQNSINNVVDASNYVLLAFGQPSHAFDVGLLASAGEGKGLALRMAKDGEKFLALDGKERTLVASDCVVADLEGASRPAEVHALLGVIGGERSKVTGGTSSVVLEFANPHPVAVRRSARRHGRKTDSSFLFEKGIDVVDRFRALCELVGLISHTQAEAGAAAPQWKGVVGSRLAKTREAAAVALTDDAALAATLGPNVNAGIAVDASLVAALPEALLAQNAAASVFATAAWIEWREARRARPSCRFGTTDLARIAGAELVGFDDQLRILATLGFQTEASTPGESLVRFPHWRWLDVSGVPDLTEEIVRVVGIDKVPSTPLVSESKGPKDDAHLAAFEKVAARAAALGYNEIAGYHFMRSDDPARMGLSGLGALGEPLALINPIIRDQPLMHTSLLPNLLRCVQRNTSFGVPRGLLFHVTRTYQNIDALGERVFAANGEGVGLAEAFVKEVQAGAKGEALLGALLEYAPQRSHAYSRETSQAGRPAETPRLAAIAFGPREEKQWHNSGAQPWPFLEIAAHAIELGLALGVPLSLVPMPEAHPFAAALHPGRRAHIVTEGGEPVGWAGEVHPACLRAFDAGTSALAFELNLAVLLRETLGEQSARKRIVAPLRFPAVSRDFAFLLSEGVQAGEIVMRVREALTGTQEAGVRSLKEVPARLVEVRVFDVYRGKGVLEGAKSVAFNVTVEPLERTLNDKDIQWLSARVVDAVSGGLKGELRGG